MGPLFDKFENRESCQIRDPYENCDLGPDFDIIRNMSYTFRIFNIKGILKFVSKLTPKQTRYQKKCRV